MQPIEPIAGLELIDLAIYIPKHKILCIADVHIGYEQALTKQGVLVPKFHFKDIIKRIEKILRFMKDSDRSIETIIINGDLKHEFGTISDEEWRNTIRFIDLLSRHCKKILLIKGNHDTILGPIAEKRKVELIDSYKVGEFFFCHGDSIPSIPKGIKTILIGHEHPAVTLRDGVRNETFKSHLIGSYRRHKIIVQPSFNQLVEGTDVKEEKLLSPFLKSGISDFRAFIIGDKIYDFGLLKKLK
ncbi:metallophosphoesterase [Nanoarchaeota archaeon]